MDAVEVVARALAIEDMPWFRSEGSMAAVGLTEAELRFHMESSGYQSRARAALAALDAAGLVVVPIEPTEAMLNASAREWDGRMSARSAGVWQAMVAARPR